MIKARPKRLTSGLRLKDLEDLHGLITFLAAPPYPFEHK